MGVGKKDTDERRRDRVVECKINKQLVHLILESNWNRYQASQAPAADRLTVWGGQATVCRLTFLFDSIFLTRLCRCIIDCKHFCGHICGQ